MCSLLKNINPRISGSLYASISAGANLVDDLISIKLKRSHLVKNFITKNKKIVYSKNIIS